MNATCDIIVLEWYCACTKLEITNCTVSRPESIMLFKLPIMLLSISQKFTYYAQYYAPLIVRNYLCLVLRLHIIIVICFLSEYLINYI